MNHATQTSKGDFRSLKSNLAAFGCRMKTTVEDYGPILLSEKATKLCRVGWIISGAVRKSGNRCVLVEAFQVYP